MRNRPVNAHTTTDELNYIRNIGTYFKNRTLPSKRVLLQNYIDALSKRVAWGVIDKDKVEAFARQELENLDLQPA